MSSTPWSKASFITKKGRLRLVVQTEKLRSRDPRATTTYISFFPLSLLTLSKTEMWKKCRLEKAFNLPGLPYTKAKLIFIEGKKGNIFFDDIGIEVIRCSGCPTKGHFTAENAFLPLLFSCKMAFCRTAWQLLELKNSHFCFRYMVFVFFIFFASHWKSARLL